MKYWTYLLLLTIVSCNNQHQKSGSADSEIDVIPPAPAGSNKQSGTEICWRGTLNGKIPIFLHYQFKNEVIIGEITYLNSKYKSPITILGTIEADKSFRLLEFEKSGNITGVITGVPTDNIFNGSWSSPKTGKELELQLMKKDSVIYSPTTDSDVQKIFGRYHYQYSEAGYQGDVEITRLPDSKASFAISSVTGEPARNIAQIEEDTIALNNTHFIYKVPNTAECEFEMIFYNGFLYIKYTKGFCEGQFGMNATIDGLFLKTE